MRTNGVVIAAVLVAATTAVPVAAGAPRCAGRTTVGRWTYVASPAWPPDDNDGTVPAGPPGLVSQPSADDSALTVVGPGNPARILLSNRRSLLRSLDGGCTWTVAFALTPVTGIDPVTRAATLGGVPSARIAQVAVPRGTAAGVRSVVWLTLQQPKVPGSYAVVRSTDDGRTWQVVTPDPVGLSSRPPRPGFATYLAPASNDPAAAYLCVDCYDSSVTGHPVAALWVTRDSGRSWNAATLPAFAPNDTYGYSTSLTVDPADARSVWLRTAHAVYRSADAGAHWTTALADVPVEPAGAGPNGSPVVAFRAPGARATTVVVPVLSARGFPAGQHLATVPTGLVSRDGGVHWQRLPDLPFASLEFVADNHMVGPLGLSFDASGGVCGYLVDSAYEFGAPTASALVLLRGNRWQSARPPYRSATYTYDPDGVFGATDGPPGLLAVGLDGAHGTLPAVVTFDVPR